MTIDLRTVTVDRFTALVDATFAVTLPSGARTSGILREAKRRGGARTFVLLFDIPETEPPNQGTVRFEHASLGTMDVFAVPIGRKNAHVQWQVIFS